MKSSDEDKVKEIRKLQETLLNNMNECIDDVIAKAADTKMIDAKIELLKVDQTVLESFVQNQGLQHLAEKIFLISITKHWMLVDLLLKLGKHSWMIQCSG